jgi:hypothetical protein
MRAGPPYCAYAHPAGKVARTQGELAALVADLSAATATKDVLVVGQTGGTWTRAGRWTVPGRIEVRTKLCRVTFDFTDAVITSRTVRIDMDMQHGKLVIVGAPGIVIDSGGLNLVFSKTKLRPYGTWQMISSSISPYPVHPAKVHFHAGVRSSAAAGFNVQNQVICAGRAMQAERTARRADSAVRMLAQRSPTKAAAFRLLTRAISASRASLARLWNHRERAWWRRVHASQWMTSHRGRGRVVRAARRRSISGMVSEIMLGSAGGG